MARSTMETLWYRRNSDDCGSGDIEQTDKTSMVEQDRLYLPSRCKNKCVLASIRMTDSEKNLVN